MLTSDQQRLVEQATVTLPGKRCRGVLIPGEMILTVAHGVTFSTEGDMAIDRYSGDDYYSQDVHTAQGGTLRGHAVFLDPCADIALLSALDNQAFPEDADAWEAWCAQVTPLPLCEDRFPFDTPIPVMLYNHHDQWISGHARQMHYDAQTLPYVFDAPIEGGTSGSPIVTADSRLIGVVANADAYDPQNRATRENRENQAGGPRPHLALPVWALRQIARHDEDPDAEAQQAQRAWIQAALARVYPAR